VHVDRLEVQELAAVIRDREPAGTFCISPVWAVSSASSPESRSTASRSWSVFWATRITHSQRPSGDQPPATCHAGPEATNRCRPVTASTTAMSTSPASRLFVLIATRLPSGDVAYRER